MACNGPGVLFEGQHSPMKEIGFEFFSIIPSSQNTKVLVVACGQGPNLACLVSTG